MEVLYMNSAVLLTAVISCTAFSAETTPVHNHISTANQEIALTFDDGPDVDNTPKILDILERYNIKATFFMLGQNVDAHPEVVKKVFEQGHAIGLHTYTHPNFNRLNKEEIRKEILVNRDAIEKATGYRSDIIRPPYGIVNDDFLCVAKELDLTVYTWSRDSFDWKTSNKETEIIRNVTDGVHPGNIILMHDKTSNQLHSRNALPRIIAFLKNRGYRFVTLKGNEKQDQ